MEEQYKQILDFLDNFNQDYLIRIKNKVPVYTEKEMVKTIGMSDFMNKTKGITIRIMNAHLSFGKPDETRVYNLVKETEHYMDFNVKLWKMNGEGLPLKDEKNDLIIKYEICNYVVNAYHTNLNLKLFS